jgi:hypothetical protein
VKFMAVAPDHPLAAAAAAGPGLTAFIAECSATAGQELIDKGKSSASTPA